jgi:uncharacterized protein (DUF433 family)
MIATPIAIDVPLRTDSDGVIRVGNTRVTLHTIIGFYNSGETPEDLHDGFPTVSLADIYAVIAYYLANRAAVDDYLHQIDEDGERIRRKIEASYTPEQKARIERLHKLVAEKRREKDS